MQKAHNSWAKLIPCDNDHRSIYNCGKILRQIKICIQPKISHKHGHVSTHLVGSASRCGCDRTAGYLEFGCSVHMIRQMLFFTDHQIGLFSRTNWVLDFALDSITWVFPRSKTVSAPTFSLGKIWFVPIFFSVPFSESQLNFTFVCDINISQGLFAVRANSLVLLLNFTAVRLTFSYSLCTS